MPPLCPATEPRPKPLDRLRSAPVLVATVRASRKSVNSAGTWPMARYLSARIGKLLLA